MSPKNSQQCGQSVTHDAIFSLSPAMVIAAMVIIKILNLVFRAMHYMKAHQMAITMMQTDWKSDNEKDEIFQNRERNYQHVGKCIAAHHIRF